jgi:tetratricopeptide (TPR) repeat protein
MELKQYDKATALFKKILEKNPEADRIHYYLGSLYEETHQANEAVQELSAIKPDSKLYGDAALHVAFLLKQANRTEESRAFIADAIRKSPRIPDFYVFSASMEDELKNTSSAVSILEGALKSFPENEKIRYYLGSLYDRQGDVDKSMEQMEAILAINPSNVDAMNYIAYTWTQKGIRLNDAEKLLKKALSLRPNNGYIQDSWGWYLFVRGRIREATIELEKAARLKPDEPVILEHLGDVYLKANLREKAAQEYEEAVKLSQDEGSRQKLADKLKNLSTEMPSSMTAKKKQHDEGEEDRAPAAEEKQESPSTP